MSIIEQQLKNHFGDEFADVNKQSIKFIQHLLSKPWFGDNKVAMIANEGGPSNMAVQALYSIIEHEDQVKDGLKAYSTRLRSEYGSDKQLDLPLDDEIEYTSAETEEEGQPVGLPSGALQSSDGAGDVIETLSALERDFFSTLASVKDIRETSSLLGISYKEGRKVYQRVHNRGTRRLQTQ